MFFSLFHSGDEGDDRDMSESRLDSDEKYEETKRFFDKGDIAIETIANMDKDRMREMIKFLVDYYKGGIQEMRELLLLVITWAAMDIEFKGETLDDVFKYLYFLCFEEDE